MFALKPFPSLQRLLVALVFFQVFCPHFLTLAFQVPVQLELFSWEDFVPPGEKNTFAQGILAVCDQQREPEPCEKGKSSLL